MELAEIEAGVLEGKKRVSSIVKNTVLPQKGKAKGICRIGNCLP